MSGNIKIHRELLTKPGDTIIETLEFLSMSQVELAERMGKTPAKVNDLISGKAPITVNTAMQLEKVLGIDMQFWLNREMQYREKLARIEQTEFLANYIEWVQEQPLKELKKLGYLNGRKIGTDTVEECLQFYGVASPIQWQSLYVDNYTQTNFQKSLNHSTQLSSMAAWLRIGELKLRELNLSTYNKDGFKASLSQIKILVEVQPDDFAVMLQTICEKVGVAVIFSSNLPEAPISGVTRWIGRNPLIQISDSYQTNDHFWFAFYHQAGHILLHGKKDVFIEDLETVKYNSEKENEAIEFAHNWLLPDTFFDEVPVEITEETVRRIAKKYTTHPAIVICRLQHLNRVSDQFGAKLKIKINLGNFL